MWQQLELDFGPFCSGCGEHIGAHRSYLIYNSKCYCGSTCLTWRSP